MSCMSVLTSVWILSIHHHRGKPKAVPKWLKIFIFVVMAKLLCANNRLLRSKEKFFEFRKKKDKKYNTNIRVGMEESEVIRMDTNTCPGIDLYHLDTNISTIDNNGYKKDNSYNSTIPSEECVRELVDLLQFRHIEDVKDEEIYKEWRDLAFILDRMFFVLYLFITTTATVFILEMRPEPSF